MNDLVVYTMALDNNKLITADNYRKITTPFQLVSDQAAPYGLGWFVQRFADADLHWAYGYGDSNSALLLRVPEQKLAFILLANSGNASGPFRLGYGDVLRSPFAVSFIKHFVLSTNTKKLTIDYNADEEQMRTVFLKTDNQRLLPIYTEELFTQALVYNQQAGEADSAPAKAIQLTQLLYETEPKRFGQRNLTLLFLLSKLPSSELSPAMEQAIQAYESKGNLHPEAHYDIAQYFEKRAQPDKALHYYLQLANHPDYQEQQTTIKANSYLGNYYKQNNQPDKARQYLWQAVKYSKQAGNNDEFTADKLQEMFPEEKK